MSLSTEDKLNILDALSRSAYALDAHDLDLLEAAYTEDAVFSLNIRDADPIPPFEGIEAIMGLYRSSLEAQTDVRRHVVSNAFFVSEGEDPVVSSNLTLFATENGDTKLLSAGVYRDTLRRTPDGWKLLKRHLDLDSPY